MHYNISLGVEKKHIFYLKKLFNAVSEMGRGYPNPSGSGMGFNFSSLLSMGRVTGKYMKIGCGDEECKTRPNPPHCHA